MKIDYENLQPEDLLDKEIDLELSKDAFKGPLICTECDEKMKKAIVDLELPDKSLTLHLEAYKCPECQKEYLTGEQAEKFDSMLSLLDAIKQKSKIKFERAANYDGKNWFIRFPTDLTKKWNKNMITDIVPITTKDFFVHIKNKRE